MLISIYLSIYLSKLGTLQFIYSAVLYSMNPDFCLDIQSVLALSHVNKH